MLASDMDAECPTVCGFFLCVQRGCCGVGLLGALPPTTATIAMTVTVLTTRVHPCMPDRTDQR
jgi:hypothetical protein